MIDNRTAALLTGILASGAVVETAAYYYLKSTIGNIAKPASAEQANAATVLKWAAVSSWLAVAALALYFGPQLVSAWTAGGSMK